MMAIDQTRMSLPLRYLLTLALLAALTMAYLTLAAPQWRWVALLRQPPTGFDALIFQWTTLPRLAVTVLVGAAMGVSGSVLQQLTQNRLVSPMTIGAASGAWLALLLGALAFPVWTAAHGEWVALGGACAAVALALRIAGRNGVTGLPLALAGMALNLLFGAMAAAVLILQTHSARGLFVWGAGDLTQIDWQWASWLWPRLLPGLALFALAPRPLTLMRLGSDGAQARGLHLWPAALVLCVAAVWLTAVSITAVGLIGFIGLIAPNLARLCGARRAQDELIYSAVLGMTLLLASDALALLGSLWFGTLIPSGATAALIGAPVLLWASRRHLAAQDVRALTLPKGARVLRPRGAWLLLGIVVLLGLVCICLNRSLAGWFWAWPTPLEWSLRWPRQLAALSAGCGLALAGALLQRVMRNPLASPDILGLTAGASLAVTGALMALGTTLFWWKAPLAAFVGSLVVLGLLLALGRRHRYAPSIMTLLGIALSALFSTVMQFVLARGESDALALLGWLAGSSYRLAPQTALYLSLGVALLAGLCLAQHRALTLLAIGDGVAVGRGLDVARARRGLLALAALLCALVTSLLGPVVFMGLLAPHMATLLGARRVLPHMTLAMLLGALVMLLADWMARTLTFPLQLPVGIVASVFCGVYFIGFLLRRQRT